MGSGSGASKAALDRVVQAAARELGPRGIAANALDPGPVDNGWISGQVLRSNGGLDRIVGPSAVAEAVDG